MKYFDVQELVDKDTYSRFGDRSLMFLDGRIPKAVDAIREAIGNVMVINTWHWLPQVNLQYRGFRPRSYEFGAEFSQHRFGRAIDFHINNMTMDQLYEWVERNEDLLIDLGFTRVEDFSYTDTWVHLDMAAVPLDGNKLVRVKP